MSISPANPKAQQTARPRSAKTKKIMIKNGKLNLRVSLDDIIYIQAEHVYVRIHLRSNQRILYRISLTDILEQLDQRQFVRVHRSYIVNVKELRALNSQGVQIGDHLIPVGRVWRPKLIAHLKSLDV
ncbi:MAG: LytTR family DNA-binding domain-containing protein [Bacteroidota bacterium]